MTHSTDPTDIPPLVTETAVRELAPSAKLVWIVLEREPAATQQAIVEATGLSQRAVHYSLSHLADNGLIEKRPYPYDARKNLYSLPDRE